MRLVLAFLLLAATYALTLASADPVDLATAALVAAAVMAALRRFLFTQPALPAGDVLGRIARFPLFAAAVAVEIVRGTWQVTLVVLGIRQLARPGIVAVPVAERSDTGIAVTAMAITLSPGEVFVDLDRERDVMLLHVIDAGDPDEVRRRHARFYDRFQRGVFP